MDASLNNRNNVGPRENFGPETYRGYKIYYEQIGGIFCIANDKGYRRGISSMRKDAKRWIDLLIAGEVKA